MDETIRKPFTKAEMDAIRARYADREPSPAADAGEGEQSLLRRALDKIRRLGRRLPFAEDLVSAYVCTLDPATPSRVRYVLIGAIAYFVLPTDAVADLLPLVGFTDDAAVLAAAIASVAGSITDAHRERAREILNEGD